MRPTSLLTGLSILLWCVAPATGQSPNNPILLEGHRKPVCALAFSADGRLLFSGDYDELRLWDLRAGKELRRFVGQMSPLNALTFTKGGKEGLSISHNRGLQQWDLGTGKQLRKESISWGIIDSVAVSPDGTTLAICGARYDRKIALWDTACLEMKREWPIGLTGIHCAAFSPDGKLLAVGGSTIGSDGKKEALVGSTGRPKEFAVELWDVSSGKSLRGLGKHTQEIRQLAFSPDGRVLAALPREGQIHLWEVPTGELRYTFEPGDAVTSMQFSPDGRFLAIANAYAYGQFYFGGKWTGKYVDRIRLCDFARGGEVRPFGQHKGAIASLAFSPDGRWLASGSHDTTVRLWDMAEAYQKSPVATSESEDLEALWKDLIGADGGKAYRAMWSLTAMPKQAVPFLSKKTKPIPEADPKLLTKLLSELNSDQFIVRQKANRELEKLGVLARPAIRRALAKDASEEFRRRAEQLLKQPEEPINTEHLRIVEVLERIGNAEAREHLRILAGGAFDARLTQEARSSLERLQRQFGSTAR